MTIHFTIENGVGKIILSRPEVLNSFNREMALAFQSAMKECISSKEVRAVLITGSGRAFCAGQDLAEAIDPNGPPMDSIVREHYNPIIKLIREIEKPVVCAVNGVAAGAGANIALACDITIAAASSTFIQAFSKIGLIPDSGGTFFLPRLIGMQKATALMMLGDKVKAAEAHALGMIYKVCEDEILMPEAIRISESLARMPTRGLGLTKKALNLSLFNNLDDQLEVEEKLQTEAGQSFDYKEGVNAFLEKRQPEFRGE